MHKKRAELVNPTGTIGTPWLVDTVFKVMPALFMSKNSNSVKKLMHKLFRLPVSAPLAPSAKFALI